MSTIKVSNIQNASTSSGGIAIDTSGHVTVDGVAMPSSGPLSNRNLIINGAMQVAQRSTSETGQSTVDGYVALDRWKIQASSSGTFTILQSTEAPDGFANSLKFDCTTADASPEYLLFFQLLEGQDLQHIQKGKSGAKQTTLSFYVRSSKTGTYQVNLRDIDNDRLVGSSYTISSADTWEYKSVTFAADTLGQFGNDNNASLQVEWWLASGPTYSGGAVPTAWETRDNTDRAAALNVAIGASTNDDFYITGVQLEVGSVATPFERRSYGDELARCQRYHLQIGNEGRFSYQGGANSSNGFFSIAFPTKMRATPSFSYTGTITVNNYAASGTITNLQIDLIGPQVASLYSSGGVSYSTSTNTILYNTAAGNGELLFSAEL
jgi:hypothetical protein